MIRGTNGVARSCVCWRHDQINLERDWSTTKVALIYDHDIVIRPHFINVRLDFVCSLQPPIRLLLFLLVHLN